MNAKVDNYLSKAQHWQKEMQQLRKIILDCGLNEELKWGKPCYDFHGSNIVVVQGFKAYCAVLFFKGFLLNDPDNILVKTGENTRVGRQIRFENVQEVTKLAPKLKAYIYEAIAVEKNGIKGDDKKETELILVEEFQQKLNKDKALKKAFETLTPGRQRAYNIYFSQAKQSKTREARIEKSVPQIMQGKGIND